VTFTDPLLARHPWVVALLLGTLATPAGVVLGWLAPRPLDAIVALPLVLVDVWAGSVADSAAAETPMGRSPVTRLLLLALGIVLTWMFYVVVARLVLWRLARRAAQGHLPDEETSNS
jgi:hypothetical protein